MRHFSFVFFFKTQIHEEIDRVVGEDGKRAGTLCYATDAQRMPWTEAVICEVQRIKTILPLGVPHGTLDVWLSLCCCCCCFHVAFALFLEQIQCFNVCFKDCELAGYRIPKGAMVVPVWWAMNLDPTLWSDPLQFRPERFLVRASHGEWTLIKPDHFLPFQSGRRMCIGDELGKTIIFLFTVTLLQRFRLTFPPQFEDYQPVVAPDGKRTDEMPRPDYGFTLVPHPYPVALHPRSPPTTG